MAEAAYLVLGGSSHPYLLARVRWPDVAQAISEDCPEWLDDPGLFDLPYELASQGVSSGRAAEIAADWGARLPDPASTGLTEPRLRRTPATWSDMARVEKRSWSLEHVTMVHRREALPEPQWPEDAAASNGHVSPTPE
jgi:hypothetical protein